MLPRHLNLRMVLYRNSLGILERETLCRLRRHRRTEQGSARQNNQPRN